MAKTLVGTCSWTDKALIEAGTFYPPRSGTAEARLRHYATQFPIVEVDSPYYALPSERNSRLWVERTPDGFVFDVKAFGLFTTHPVQVKRLPGDLRAALPGNLLSKRNVYLKDVGSEVIDEAWRRFREALMPLHDAGRLGVVTFQFPRWFVPDERAQQHIADCQERLPGWQLAVEFRNHRWLEGEQIERTLGFLKERRLAFVCVDEPQGFASSAPPLAEATSDVAVVRFHGRNSQTWEKPGITASQRFDYFYERSEFEEWLPNIRTLQDRAAEVHLLINTNNYDQGPVNARLLLEVLAAGVGSA